MKKESCMFCCTDAATERSTLALCHRCAHVWDKASEAQKASIGAARSRSRPGPEDNQVCTLLRALRYLVRNTLPQELSDYREQGQIVDDLDEIIKLGDE